MASESSSSATEAQLIQRTQERYDVFVNRLDAALAAKPKKKEDVRKWEESLVKELVRTLCNKPCCY